MGVPFSYEELHAMTQAFFDHPYLSGHHEPVRFEASAPDLIVEGEIPDDLAGVFYRNGPEPLYPTRTGLSLV
jgi:carotenoid cleavage dioxygenase-like enzyme